MHIDHCFLVRMPVVRLGKQATWAISVKSILRAECTEEEEEDHDSEEDNDEDDLDTSK